MKFTITLHPVSLLVGAAALGGVLWLVSAVQAPASTGAATARAVSQVPLTITNPIEVKGVAVPGNMVTIKEGNPYAVPAGKILVVTALGATTTSLTCTGFGCPSVGTAQLLVDNQAEVSTVLSAGFLFNDTSFHAMAAATFGDGLSMRELPTCLAVQAGSTVTLNSGAGNARAWGYLAVP